MSPRLVLVLALLVAACSKRSAEEDYVVGEVAALERAIAERDLVAMMIGCTTTTTSLPRMPATLATKIRKLCHVDAPRIHLEEAIAEATELQREQPTFPEALTCIHMSASEALETLAEHPPADPALQQLVAAYTRLCPETVAKLRRDD